VIVALEVVAIRVKYFSRPFDVSLVPIGFYLGSVGKGDYSEPIFLSIHEISNIGCFVGVIILSLSILLSFVPHAVVDIAVGVFHFAHAVLNVVPPLPLVDVAVGVAVPPEALLAILDNSLEALSVLEEVVAVDE
jgi:hypothetical protein